MFHFLFTHQLSSLGAIHKVKLQGFAEKPVMLF